MTRGTVPGAAARAEQAALDLVPGGSAPKLTSALASALGHSVLVEYVECGGTLYAIVVPGTSPSGRPRELASFHPLGPVRPLLDELDSLRFAWRRLLTGHGSDASLEAAARLAAHAASQLDRALLAPLARTIEGRPLVVVSPGQLQSLPWPMLPGCAGRPVTLAPSAATWLAGYRDAAGAPAASGARQRVVLIAGPDLPGAAAEIIALAALYPGAQVLARADATVAATLQALDGADIAHIAAHGLFRADNPMFSSVMLADGPLTVHDLERLRRAPRAVMLAACDSARTMAQPGDEMTGLASALLAVGARCVVAPLLPLPDELAVRLAHGWHSRLRSGDRPALALAATSASAGQDGQVPLPAGSALVCLGYAG